jgi:hypothetical protein
LIRKKLQAIIMVRTSILSFLLLATCFAAVYSRGISGSIKLVSMRGNQYWFSTSSPYAPQLNFYLAYQYCRNLGLQLLTLETMEEVESIAEYLTSAEGGEKGLKEYWTSGNRLGTDSWLWMSSGEQMNSSFILDYGLQGFRQTIVSPSSKLCLDMRVMSSRRTIFGPESCERSIPFICEQIRCLSYYYPTVEYPGSASPTPSSEYPNGQRSDVEEDVGVTNATSVVTDAP